MPAAAQGSRWVWRDWNDGAVVFDRLTGDTHALDPLSVELCHLAPAERANADLATQSIATHLNEVLDDNLRNAVKAAFDRLQQRELV